MFKRKHTIISNEDVSVIEYKLLSPTVSLQITKTGDQQFFGKMKNAYGTSYHVVSRIGIKTNKDNTTVIEIVNDFDWYTQVVVILFFIIFWGIVLKDLFTGSFIIDFETIFFFFFPIVGFIGTKISLGEYDRRMMAVYENILKNNGPD